MTTRNLFALSALIALCAAPIAAVASGSDRAADACIQAFVDSYLPKDRTVRVRKLSPAAGPLRAYTKHYTINLSARLSRSGNELVSARCVANGNGQVIELDDAQTNSAVATHGVANLK